MECQKCRANVPLTAKFCPSCAAPLIQEGDIRSPSEVTLGWIQSILEGQGYKVEVTGAAEVQDSLIATHDSAPNLLVSLRHKVSLITFQIFWRIHKPGWGQKADFFSAVNKANSLNWLCTCYASEELDSLNVSGALYMTERLSKRDVAAFIDIFSTGALSAIESSGIVRFA